MEWPRLFGYLVFFLLPLLLWLIATAAVKRNGLGARLFAFIAGSDNRLSMSRLQALAWALVIFGSFAAARAIHTKILAANPADIKKATDDVKATSDKVE